MKQLSPTQAGRAYLIRMFGPFLVTIPKASQDQLLKAYIAGVRHGRNGRG